MPVILLVEDDLDTRDMLEILIGTEGYTVYTAANGRDAWAMLAHIERPAIILSDIMMPFMNGKELSERIRNDPKYKAIPIVLMTAAPQESHNVLADAVLRKPLNCEDLLKQFSDILKRQAEAA